MRAARKDKTHKPSDLCTLEQAAVITREALVDLLDAKPDESLAEAFARAVDERAQSLIMANNEYARLVARAKERSRWYRRLYRFFTQPRNT